METVSIVIPAYNKPDYLRLAVKSLLDQSYESLIIIVSDDNSPIDLSVCLDGLEIDEQKTINIYRNKRNLGPYWNFHEARKYVKTKYAMFFPHDDCLVDKDFIKDSMKIFEEQADCSVVIGNSIIENSDYMLMPISFWPFVRFDGDCFIEGPLWGPLHPSYSGLIFDYSRIIAKGYDDFLLSEEACKKLGLEPDEFFLSIMLAAENSSVFISGRLVSVRGNPADSYSKTLFWRTRGALSCFIPQYQMYRYFMSKNKLMIARRIAKNIIFRYPVESLSLAPFKLIGYEKPALYLYMSSFLVSKLRLVLRFPKSFLIIIRRFLFSSIKKRFLSAISTD